MIKKLAINEWHNDITLTCAEALRDLQKMGVLRNGKKESFYPFVLVADPEDPLQVQVRLNQWWIQTLRFDSPLAVPVFLNAFNQFREIAKQHGEFWQPSAEEIERLMR